MSVSSKSVSHSVRQKTRLVILFTLVITFPIIMNYLSVYLIIEGSSNGVMVFSFFFWAAWVIFALFLGRASCGWICPLGAYQETKDRMAPKDLKKIKNLRWIKYFLALLWVGTIIYFAIAAGGYRTINLLYNTETGISVSTAQSWITWGMIVIIILLPAFLIGRRGFCHYFCPWGVLNMMSTKLANLLHVPTLHLKAEKKKCKQCQTCLANCPMSLSIGDMIHADSVKNNECILCGTCVDICPNRAIKFSWGKS